MRLPLLFLILIFSYLSSAQDERFQIQGRITNKMGNPVEDAYVINFRTLDKYVSRENGVFNIWVLPSDSLVISHISYHRKVVRVFDLLINPYIQLKLDSVQIEDVNISPNQKTENQIAQENVADIKAQNFPVYTKIDDEPDPVSEMATEHNKVLRSEASSISIIRFSPTDIIGKLIEKSKKRKKSNQYKSTRKKK